jgi:hypothetical protein
VGYLFFAASWEANRGSRSVMLAIVLSCSRAERCAPCSIASSSRIIEVRLETGGLIPMDPEMTTRPKEPVPFCARTPSFETFDAPKAVQSTS